MIIKREWHIENKSSLKRTKKRGDINYNKMTETKAFKLVLGEHAENTGFHLETVFTIQWWDSYQFRMTQKN